MWYTVLSGMIIINHRRNSSLMSATSSCFSSGIKIIVLKILSIEYHVWISQKCRAETLKAPVCSCDSTNRSECFDLWTHQWGVKEDFEPEVSVIWSRPTRQESWHFPPCLCSSHFIVSCSPCSRHSRGILCGDRHMCLILKFLENWFLGSKVT